MCASLRDGEIVLFGKAYLHFAHLGSLAGRGVFFVTRAKDNLTVRVKKRLPAHADPRILRDELIALTGHHARRDYPGVLRRVTTRVEVDGLERERVILTNNLAWSPRTVSDLYRCRWSIEVFFKLLKQTVQLVDFLGNNANAVKGRVGTALRVHRLLRFLVYDLSYFGSVFKKEFGCTPSRYAEQQKNGDKSG